MQLLESSFDLLQNPLFTIQKRASWMMPTPFILNDAVVNQTTYKTITTNRLWSHKLSRL
jgi:hypothetical protein